MRYTDQDVEEVINAYFVSYDTSKNARGHTADASTVHCKAHEQGVRAARAALEAMEREPMEEVLGARFTVVLAGVSQKQPGTCYATVIDGDNGCLGSEADGATIDEAIRNAVAAANEGTP